MFQAKLNAIGFGFLIPVLFVVTGVQFNVDALFSHSSALELVPLLVVAILVVRGTPALLYRARVGARGVVAIAFLQSATLTFPVVVSEIGLSLGLPRPSHRSRAHRRGVNLRPHLPRHGPRATVVDHDSHQRRRTPRGVRSTSGLR